MSDMVNHPPHYQHSSGVECIDLNELLDGNTAAAFKYVFRYRDKGNLVENLKKALWYIDREISFCSRGLHRERVLQGKVREEAFARLTQISEGGADFIYRACRHLFFSGIEEGGPAINCLTTARDIVKYEISKIQ